MRKEYDIKKLDLKPGPYAAKLKRTISIRLDDETVEYFKDLSEKKKIPYQTLINDFLRYCKDNKLEPKTIWKKTT